MSNENEVLQPHRHRTLRAFLREPDRGKHSATHALDAFWAVVYDRTVVDHETAVAVEFELSASDRTVSEVLGGWRPAALRRS